MRPIAVVALGSLITLVGAAPSPSPNSVRYHNSAVAPVTTREIIAVYLGTNGTDRQSGMVTVVPQMKAALARQAGATGRRFISRGVSLEEDVESGLRDLALLGPFDEVSVGGNWTNSSVVRYLGSASTSNQNARIPQVVVLERVIVGEAGDSLDVGPERELARYIGVDKIDAWVRRGAPLP